MKRWIPYIQLLRLPDQYIQFGSAIVAGLYSGEKSWWIFWWAIATTCISFTAFIANELTDRTDVDRLSWNHVHIGQSSIQTSVAWVLATIFAVIGLGIATALSLFWWATAMLTFGLLYSLEPFRFKRRVIVDIIAQLVVWWGIPLAAPIFRLAREGMFTFTPHDMLFAITMFCIQWGLFYPYQLADFAADQAIGFRNTHILLGMKNSLRFGLALLITGIALYGIGGFFSRYIWTIPFTIVSVWVINLYIQWLGMTQISQQAAAMQAYVRRFKPVSQGIALLYFFLWLVI